jgi:glycerol dehydrogenase-like iron-containing ADH family enzyme
MTTVWPLPRISYKNLKQVEETRPVALLTSEAAWNQVGDLLNLPLVVQAEPEENDRDLLNYLADNLPSQAEAVYVVGEGTPLIAGKIVANVNKLPLIVIPTRLDTDMPYEGHVLLTTEGLLTYIDTGPPSEVVIDWDVIQAAPHEERAGAIVDVLAIVTALLDWRYAAKLSKNTERQKFSSWAAGVAAGLASQAIKSAKEIGEGKVEALKTLVDLMLISVQLASQLDHDRHQEGTEHYFGFSLENQGAEVSHASAVGPGILWAAALHGQDPAPLRDALESAGVALDRLRTGDVQLAVRDLPNFCATNNLPYSRAHDIDPFSDQVRQTLERAGIIDVEGWQLSTESAAGEEAATESSGEASD